MSELELLECASRQGRRVATRIHRARRRARRIEPCDLVHARDRAGRRNPKKGGALRLGLGGGSTTDSWDIGSYNNSVMIDASHGVFNGLIEWAQDGKPKPDLASSIEPSKDAKEWVFNLRKGVKFSNGKELTADDAIYSLNYHRGDSKSGGKSSVAAIDDIQKLDKNQFKVILKSGDADFLYSLTDYHLLVVPDGFKDWANPVGTGAFLRREIRSRRARRAEEKPGLLQRATAGSSTPPRSSSSMTASHD